MALLFRQTAVTGDDAFSGENTAARDEVTYLVEPEHLAALVTALGRRLPHQGAGKRPRHFITTIYFDTAARHRFRAGGDAGQPRLKLRANESYDLHPSLAELATDPRQIVPYQAVLWLEVELTWNPHRVPDLPRRAPAGNPPSPYALLDTGTRCIGIPKRDVPAFFAGGVLTAETIELQRPLHGARGEAVLREIASACGRYGQPLRADCLANYRRLPWQDTEGRLRVTLDVGLEFYAPPSDLWEREHALVRESLGPARGRQTSGVLAVEARADSPAWLGDLLARFKAERCRYSKFEEASLAVHGATV
jgi:hypothetical protein